MRLETQFVTALDGVELFVRRYSPDQFDGKRILYWIHGLGEHGGRQEHLAAVFAQRGWQLVIADLRGHGKSGGLRTFVRSFDEYLDDLSTIWRELGLANAAPMLLGHSMGGLVAIRAVESRRLVPSALVLSSPLLGVKVKVKPLIRMLAKVLVRVVPKARFANGIDPANMTRDSEFTAKRRGDPLINKTVTAGWYFAMQAALASAQAETARITLPVLALQGEADQTTDPLAVREWFHRIGSVEKTIVILPDHIHELFFEPDWNQTTNFVIDWLEERLKASYRLPTDESNA
jgi:alpha-beta hydrolase superfamily lysophospholipase